MVFDTIRDAETGKDYTTKTRVFKNTLVNLTLKAIGSSIPVIHLCCHEIYANGFQARVATKILRRIYYRGGGLL